MMQRFTVIALFISHFLFAGCDEIGSKSEHAILQEVEYANRQIIISKTVIISKRGYIIAGFRSKNDKSNTWVLLNPKYFPYYKQIPQFDILISPDEFDQIRHIVGVSKTVIDVLEKKIEHKK